MIVIFDGADGLVCGEDSCAGLEVRDPYRHAADEHDDDDVVITPAPDAPRVDVHPLGG